MGLLNQKDNEYVIYIGWYGACNDCNAFDLPTHRDKLYAVYQFSEGGKGIKSFLSSAPDYLQNFTELQCGKMYWIVLNPGTSSVDIPNFVQTSYSNDESNLGHLQLCDTTSLPTPTPKDEFIEIQITTEKTNDDLYLPIYDIHSGGVVIDWGDSSMSQLPSDIYDDYEYIAHRYENIGTYTIKITGDFKIFGLGVMPYKPEFWRYKFSKFIREIKIRGMSQLYDIRNLLHGAIHLEDGDIDFSEFDTSNIENMSRLFARCTGLKNLDLSSFNTSKVEDMSHMFDGCDNLVNLNVSSFDTSRVTNFRGMFSRCSSIISLDISNFNTASAHDINSMFAYMTSLSAVDVSNFNTEHVNNMAHLFNHCKALVNIDVSNFDTSRTYSMGWMFANCTLVSTLDLSNFDISRLTGATGMFLKCSALQQLNIPSFVTSTTPGEGLPHGDTMTDDYLDNMFHGCVSLNNLDLSHWCVTAFPEEPYRFATDAPFYANENNRPRWGEYHDECTGPEPTPTPVLIATPTPTPTPLSTQGCCPDQASVFETAGGFDPQSHSYTPLGENTKTLLTWKGFAAGGKLCVDLTFTDGWSHDGFESTRPVYLNSESSPQIGTIKKMMKNGEDRGNIYYNDGNGNCYQGDYSSNPVVLQEIEPSFGPTPTPESSASDGPMNFDEASSDYEDLSTESRTEMDEIHGVVKYIPLEGGFYGIVSDNDSLNYLPINIQEDLKGHDGSRIIVRNSYLQTDAVSIFQWGTLIYVTNMELEGSGGPIGCFKDLRPCGNDGEFVVRDPKLNCNFPPCFFDADEFYYMKKNWLQKGISSYQYIFSWSCFCPEEATKQVEITVIDNEIHSIYDMNGHVVENGEESWFRYYTMSDLYEFIELEFKKFPHTMSVHYNEAWGYSLKSWFVDKDLMIMDEELGFYITDFRILDDPPVACTEDARQCTDGHVVVRDPKLNCNFPPCKFDNDEFFHAWKTWSEFGHAAPSDAISYEYTFRWICECENSTTQEVRITVINGELEGITDLSGEPVDLTIGLGYYTMTGLYEFIQDELTTFPYLMWFEYDDTTGVLTEWFVDRHPEMADDELGFVVSDFTILQGD